jgi:hypothetical protein
MMRIEGFLIGALLYIVASWYRAWRINNMPRFTGRSIDVELLRARNRFVPCILNIRECNMTFGGRHRLEMTQSVT